MRIPLVPVLLAASMGATAQTAVQVLGLLPDQTEAIAYYPKPKALEAKWSALAGLFGKKEGLVDLQAQTGIDPSRLGPGPLVKITLPKDGDADRWAWLLPTAQPKSLLQGLKAKQDGKAWTWIGPASAPRKDAGTAAKQGKLQAAKPTAPSVLQGVARPGFLLVANSPAALAAFQKPGRALATELAPFVSWIEAHDVALVATELGVRKGAQDAGVALKEKPAAPEPAEGPALPSPKAPKRFQSTLEAWMEQAKVSVHHVLASLDLGPDGGLRFEAKALLIKDSPLARQIEALPAVAGNPLAGLPASGFALAMGGAWSPLFDVQAALVEDLDKDGKVQAATRTRLTQAYQSQSALIRSWAATLGAPVPGQPFLGGLSTLVRVADARAYFAATEELSKAQGLFFEELGMPGAVEYVKDPIAGVPSGSVSTRLTPKAAGSGAEPPNPALAMLVGGEAIQVSSAALDDHRLLMVVGPPEQLKARLEAARKAPDQLPPSIAAIAPELGSGHHFALYLDLPGLRDFLAPLAGMFLGPEAKPLPAVPAVPALGIGLVLGPEALELRGSLRGETLRAAAQFFKAVETMFPKEKKGEKAQGK